MKGVNLALVMNRKINLLVVIFMTSEQMSLIASQSSTWCL